MTLNEMLAMIDKLAEDGMTLPTELTNDLKDKIDSYGRLIDWMKKESVYYSERAEAMEIISKRYDKKINSLKNHMANNMRHFGWSEVDGKTSRAVIVKTKKFIIKGDPDQYANRDFVKIETKAKFDLEKLKQLCSEAPEAYASICAFEDSEHLRFT